METWLYITLTCWSILYTKDNTLEKNDGCDADDLRRPSSAVAHSR
ncbi:MAG: hypothetical protein ACI84K_002105, partial [Pseudohongiellaceae bacterium]